MNYLKNHWQNLLGKDIAIKHTNGIEVSGKLTAIINDKEPTLQKIEVETNIPSEIRIRGREFKTATIYAMNVKNLVQL